MFAATLCALSGCGGDGTDTPTTVAATTASGVVVPTGFALDEATITTASGDERTISVWVADSSADRGRGLMDVTDLGDADGMLFVFDSEGVYRFFMWQTPMPLDIAFFAADGSFVGQDTMAPCLEPTSADCDRYAPDAPFLVALEVPAGTLDDVELGVGARISHDRVQAD